MQEKILNSKGISYEWYETNAENVASRFPRRERREGRGGVWGWCWGSGQGGDAGDLEVSTSIDK